MPSDDPCTEYEERAAILEYVAGFPRMIAERKAREQLEAASRTQGELFAAPSLLGARR